MADSLYKRRIADGFCGMCGKESIVEGESLGPACKEKSRLAAEKKRKKLKKAGMCIGCGKEPPEDGSTRCRTCLDNQAGSRKRASQRLQDEGLCRNAASHGPVKPGTTMCQACIDKLSATSSEHYRRRKDAGLCRFGNHPPIPGESMCEYHKTQHADYRTQSKMEVMETYGGCQCAWPGCDNINLDELHLHHVKGGGCAHRREIDVASGGYNFYRWLRNEGYPDGYAVLCPTHHTRADNNLKKGVKWNAEA